MLLEWIVPAALVGTSATVLYCKGENIKGKYLSMHEHELERIRREKAEQERKRKEADEKRLHEQEERDRRRDEKRAAEREERDRKRREEAEANTQAYSESHSNVNNEKETSDDREEIVI